uniref:Solute carrier family 16 member 12 n=1 Tax=Eptatretus burgeri TaxID=7764 RepID=A0A8C4NDE5_EPTBU
MPPSLAKAGDSLSNVGIKRRESNWGWVVVAAAFTVSLCTRAVTRSLSVFILEFNNHFGQHSSATAWIISINDCLTMCCAPLGMYFVSRFGYKATVMLGGILSSTGFVVASFGTSIPFLSMTLGLVSGLGYGLCYSPSVAIVTCYFDQWCSFPMGLATIGSGVGTFILAPVSQFLIEKYSWRGALLILGGLVAHICVCAALFRPPPNHTSSLLTHRKSCDKEEHLKEQTQKPCCYKFPPRKCDTSSSILHLEFVVYFISTSILACGYIIPLVYIVPFAYNCGVSERQAAFLLAIIGIVDIFGNITHSWVIDRKWIRPFQVHTFAPMAALYGVSVLLLAATNTYSLMMACAIPIGYCNGVFMSLMPFIASKLVGAKDSPKAIGMMYFGVGISLLVIPPFSGWIIDITRGYSAAFQLSGAFLLLSGVLFEGSLFMACLWKGRTYGLPKWKSNPSSELNIQEVA